ncbi:hypothetical protein CRG98_045141 [Punica granatum]|uniref:Protein RFT1 homolog n=1 Tax=Punica granatum TaxID=22663 RepID=A0A2I0HT64_PUNGR|nr:hypothetical protein CRG98_045141 [Punica granatum]
MFLRIAYSGAFIRQYFQEQDPLSFSFRRCFPSGGTTLLLSGLITLISERLFLDKENFFPTFLIHLAVGLMCLCMSAFVIYRRERAFINRIVRFRDHVD